MITCTSCNTAKEFSLFKKDTRKKSGFASICKECAAVQAKEYYSKNKEEILSKPKDVEKKRRQDRESYMRHREKRIQHVSEWVKKNPAKALARNASRRARKKQAEPQWLTCEERNEILGKYAIARWLSLTCFQGYHVDHIVPLKGDFVSGLHVPWNLQIIPATENLRKNKRFEG